MDWLEQDRWPPLLVRGGKSGLRRARRWITSSGGDPRDSATERSPPASAGKGERVR